MTTPPPDFEYVTNATFADLARRLGEAQRAVILTHGKIDGDAIGSALGVGRALRERGVRTSIHLAGPVDRNLLELVTDEDEVHRLEEDGPPPDEADTVVVVDTGSWTQLHDFHDFLKAQRDKTLLIDHHARGDDVALMRIIDVSAASASILVLELLDVMGVTITPEIAEPLFTGIATDTGWFRHNNADPRAFRAAARLMDAGADKAKLYALIEANYRPQRIMLIGRALASMELAADGAAAVMTLTQQDFAETGGDIGDLPGVVNMPLDAGSVRASIFLTETEPDHTKISFRSKPTPPGGTPHVLNDVNLLASKFGGGGHKHAAGAKIDKPIAEAKREVLAMIRRFERGAERAG